MLYELPTDSDGLIRSLACGRLLDREVLVSGGSDASIRVWDLEDCREILEIPGAAYGFVDAVALLEPDKPGGTPVILSGGNDDLRLWNPTDGTPIGKGLEGHDATITCLDVGRFSQETIVVSGSRDGTVRTWTLSEDQHATESRHVSHDGSVIAVAMRQLPGQEMVVSSGFDSTIRRWHLSDGAPAGQPLVLESEAWGARAVAVAERDGRWLIAAGGGHRVQLWDFDSGERLQAFTGHTGPIRGVAIGDRQGRPVIVSASTDSTIRIWDPTTAAQLGDALTTGYDKSVEAIAITRWNGRTLVVSGGGERNISTWDLECGRQIGEPLEGHDDYVRALAIGDIDGRHIIVSGGDDRTVRMWDLDERTPIGEPFVQHEDWVRAVGIGEIQGHSVILSAGKDRVVRVWSPSGDLLRTIDIESGIYGMSVYAGSTVILAASKGLVALRLNQ
jgi:WD40 repeat protein